MPNTQESRLGLDDEAIRDLAQRLAMHLREELGDRLIPLQDAFEAHRTNVTVDAEPDGEAHR